MLKEILAENLRALLKNTPDMNVKTLSEQSGLSAREINYLLGKERAARIVTVETIAECFGITGWQMMMPGLHLHLDLIKNGKLTELIDNYCKSSPEGRNYIVHVAAREAGYRPTSPEGLCGGKEISNVGPKSKSARV